MSRRREIARRLDALSDIAGIMSAMKGLALMEIRILTDFLASQQRMVFGIEDAAADFLQAHPEFASEAEAERERRSNIINAEGEMAAAEKLAQAAKIISAVPGALNLRTLNTIERISTEPSQKTTMLFPIELIDAVRDIGAGLNKR